MATTTFSDTHFGRVEAPAYVRYPIGSEHAAMTETPPVPTTIFTWWGTLQTTIATEVIFCRLDQ